MYNKLQEETFDIKKWEKKRKWTTRAFTLECAMLGMEYSVTFLTLWLYIKDLIDTEYPKVFYSLVASSYLLAAVILSVIIGKWVDRTRKVRKIFLICNTMVIIGNILYSIHFSPWYLVIGRLVSGADGPLRSVISGEIARCYPDHEVLGKFSSMGMAFALGFIMGPGVNFMFTSVDFTIGYWHVTYVNVPGVYMAVFFFITQVFVYFTVHDLSKEYDLKSEQTIKAVLPNDMTISEKIQNFNITISSFQPVDDKFSKSVQIPSKPKQTIVNFCDDTYVETILQRQANRNKFRVEQLEMSSMFFRPVVFPRQSTNRIFPVATENNTLLASGSSNHSGYSSTSDNTSTTTSDSDQSKSDNILCTILSNVDALLILILTFILWYWMVAFDMWLPIMVIDVMEMGIIELNGIVFGFGCISAVILCIMSFKTFSDKTLYYLSLVCMVSLAIMELIFIYMRYYHTNIYINVVLWSIWGTLFAIVVIMDEVFLVGVMAKMTSSKVQTLTESLRLAMSRFGALLALLTSAIVFEWVVYVCSVGILVCILTLVVLVLRRKTLSAPVISIK